MNTGTVDPGGLLLLLEAILFDLPYLPGAAYRVGRYGRFDELPGRTEPRPAAGARAGRAMTPTPWSKPSAACSGL
ncbi:MAG: hypothetical protein ACRDRR_22830 [Pseudonocardiaceae bacterium]